MFKLGKTHSTAGSSDASDQLEAAGKDLRAWLATFNWFFVLLLILFAIVLCAVFLAAPTDVSAPLADIEAARSAYATQHEEAANLKRAADERARAAETEPEGDRKRAALAEASIARGASDRATASADVFKHKLDRLLKASGDQRWNLLLVALGALAIGMLIGFLFSTFGEEAKTFSAFTTAVNGFIAGAAVTDLAKDGSIIRRLFVSLAHSGGMPGAGVVVAAIAISFFTVGFFFLYVNKRLLLNILTAISDREISTVTTKRELVRESVRITAAEPGQVPEVSPAVREAASDIVNSPDAGKVTSLDALMADAKAYYLASRFQEAEAVLRKALELYPAESDVLLYLANALIAQDRAKAAIPYLERLVTMPGARAVAWKLLGYAYLWQPNMLRASAEASRAYLATHPDDLGAKINLAAALASPGPQAATDDLWQLIRDIASVPAGKQRLKELTATGEEFASWRDVADFKALIA